MFLFCSIDDILERKNLINLAISIGRMNSFDIHDKIHSTVSHSKHLDHAKECDRLTRIQRRKNR